MNGKNIFYVNHERPSFSIVVPIDLGFHVLNFLSTRFGTRHVCNVGGLNSRKFVTNFTTMGNLGMVNMLSVKANCDGILLKIVDTFSPLLLIISSAY